MYVLELVGEDDEFAIYEASALARKVELLAPGVAQATRISPRADQLAYTRRIGRHLLNTQPHIPTLTQALADHPIAIQSGSVAVRARAIRGTKIDTPAVERALGTVLTNQGFSVDLENPDHELRVICSGSHAIVHWLELTPEGGFHTRRPTNRPFFQPGSMSPRLARALVNIAGITPGGRLLDPMCGTGGILIEAGLIGAVPIGVDVQRRMIVGAQRNVHSYVRSDTLDCCIGDATRLPFIDDSIDAVVFDAPYGRQSRVAGRSRMELLEGVLQDVLRLSDRAVIVTDQPAVDAIAAAGWEILAHFERRVHRSLTRYIYDLTVGGGKL